MKKILLIVAIPALALLVGSIVTSPQEAGAQSGTRRSASAKKPPHYEHLWAWLKKHDYTKWKGADGSSPDFVKGQSPHGALIKTYVSKLASKDLKNLPNGSVIVKENYSPDKKLMAITVMHRSVGFDRKNDNWYYAKYMADGKIARTPPAMKKMPIAGSFKNCIECHSGAGGKDYLFFND